MIITIIIMVIIIMIMIIIIIMITKVLSVHHVGNSLRALRCKFHAICASVFQAGERLAVSRQIWRKATESQ
jgi:hypothetical protein